MLIEASCPNGHRLQVPIEHAGMKLRCPACNVVFQLSTRADGATTAVATMPSASVGAAPNSATATAAASTATASAGSNSNAPGSAPLEPASSRWSGTEASPSPGISTTPIPPASNSTPVPTPRPAATAPHAGRGLPQVSARDAARTAIGLGLLLVLTARGCDGLAVKYVTRLQSQIELAQRAFEDEREQAIADVRSMLEQPNVTAPRKTELEKQLTTLDDTYDRRRREMQLGEWQRMAGNVRRATAQNQATAVWREATFVVGTLLLALGLAAAAFAGEGPERWPAFGLLAIVVFSIYIAGAPWLASISAAIGK